MQVLEMYGFSCDVTLVITVIPIVLLYRRHDDVHGLYNRWHRYNTRYQSRRSSAECYVAFYWYRYIMMYIVIVLPDLCRRPCSCFVRTIAGNTMSHDNVWLGAVVVCGGQAITLRCYLLYLAVKRNLSRIFLKKKNRSNNGPTDIMPAILYYIVEF